MVLAFSTSRIPYPAVSHILTAIDFFFYILPTARAKFHSNEKLMNMLAAILGEGKTKSWETKH